jgi:prepilin-type N-terminal cleavage/methylation domain-containing protein
MSDKNKGDKGFTFIEVLIALLILSIFASTFLLGLATSSKAVVQADEKTTAESLARCQLESIKIQSYIPADDDDVATYALTNSMSAGYTIYSVGRDDIEVGGVVGVPWDTSANTAVSVDAGLQRIKLIIKHGVDTVFTIEDYKVDR